MEHPNSPKLADTSCAAANPQDTPIEKEKKRKEITQRHHSRSIPSRILPDCAIHPECPVRMADIAHEEAKWRGLAGDGME